MYFTIKYIDYDEFETNKTLIKDPSSVGSISNDSMTGENKRLLVNPDCPIGIIRDYIAGELLLRGDDIATFELCTERGSIIKTSNIIPSLSGLEVLKEKEFYYVILSSNNVVDNPDVLTLLTPLLNKFSKEYIDFMALQKRKSSTTKSRRSASSKSSSNNTISGSSTSKTISQILV